MGRLIAGFLAAAIWLPLLILLQRGLTWPGAVLVLLYATPMTLLAAPIVYLLRRRLSLVLCGIFGTLFGLVGAIGLMGTNPLAAPRELAMLRLGRFGLIGLISGALFWVVGVYRNDRLTIARAAHDTMTTKPEERINKHGG
jgi:hypothetical protein